MTMCFVRVPHALFPGIFIGPWLPVSRKISAVGLAPIANAKKLPKHTSFEQQF